MRYAEKEQITFTTFFSNISQLGKSRNSISNNRYIFKAKNKLRFLSTEFMSALNKSQAILIFLWKVE